MKRSAANADLSAAAVVPRRGGGGGSSGRSTRSTARQAELEQLRMEQEHELKKTRLQRAKDLTATPLLQALPLVLTSGFLYKHDIRSAALASKSWKSIWVEAQHELPGYCQVEIKLDGVGGIWPCWVQVQGLENVIPTQEFSRTIFTKISELKVAAEKTERKKQQVRDALPKWGTDFLGIKMLIWAANSHNHGGIYFTLNVKHRYDRGGFPSVKLNGWAVRIDHELILWTWDSFHRWKKIYNWKPLWEHEMASDSEQD